MVANNAKSKALTVGDELDFITDVEALLAYFDERGVNVSDNEADRIRSLEILKDKAALIGVPFLIKRWRFTDSTYDKTRFFVSAEIILRDGREFVLNDGSTGIADQLWKLTEVREATGRADIAHVGRMVGKGLRKSDYTYTDEKGNETPATTYYLDF